MHDKNFTALFAVIMALLLVPFGPAYIEEHFNADQHDSLGIPAADAASSNEQTVSQIISQGYLGHYHLTAVSKSRILGVSTGRAPGGFASQETNRSHSVINLQSGQAATVWVDFLNVGTTTWTNDGDHFIAMNLAEPAGRDSMFEHDYWLAPYRPAKLLQNRVEPGQTGRFRFALQAPDEPGVYKEKFNLVAEDLLWLEGGYFELIIGVGEKIAPPPDYQATETGRSHGGLLEIDPGQAFTFWIDFENTGLKNWYRDTGNFLAVNVTHPSGRHSVFQHEFWHEHYYRPGRLTQARIYPGETGRFRFALQAPDEPGYYTEHFALVAENHSWLPGGEFTLRFKVGDPEPEQVITTSIGINGPDIRIGLYDTVQPVIITSAADYTVTDLNTNTAVRKKAGTDTTLTFSATNHWQVTPSSENVLQITSYDNRPAWNTDLNDNTFRGTIELHYADMTNSMWVINKLPLESYLAGLAEVSNGQPTEYLKALITAARSYALWHIAHGGKHPDEGFDINATTDQIYRGYGFEQRSQDPLAAVRATAGTVITHAQAVTADNPHGIALAPYSSGTDGRTRGWTEVWSGNGFPWLLSVDDPHGAINNYHTLIGNHMVGMSANGARGYATEENKTYDWILQHYYTGVAVGKIY